VGYICSCTGALASSITVNWQAYEAYVSYTNAHAGKVNTTDCSFWLGTKNGQFNEPYGLKPEWVPGG
jgi:hypothetical protein